MSNSDIIYRLYKDSDFTEYVKLYLKVFKKNISKQYFDWKFRSESNPAYIFCAFNSEGDMVAARVILLTDIMCNGETIKGAQSVDSMVDSDYRGRGIYKNLNILAIDVIEKLDVKWIITFPNGNSFPALQKIGWEEVSPISIKIKVLRYKPFAPNIPGLTWPLSILDGILAKRNNSTKFSITELDIFNKHHESFIFSTLRHKTHQKRSAEYLNWKYHEKPNSDYVKLEFRKDNKIMALFVIRRDANAQRTTGTILESIIHENENKKVVFQHLISYLRRTHFDVVKVWETKFSNDNTTNSIGSFRRKNALRFAIKNVGEKRAENEVWFISAGDADTA
ncbi:GNAT family N-acetyltransferase [Guptibacillus algicola]|uniref:GNAT family N-acetyltransferase n=1 Tax=Guptibacillus algicola TaxID=225844 RepID=UPI001CD30468|nr:GNAT family N-acetyltransferase [Alkalihalobacillus algicola]MCA0986859.1 GNAT family N-acetyltransferase [Alkalihalobacillus algicola]